MRLSTSTCLYAPTRFSDAIMPTDEMIRRCYNAGFRVLDINLCYLSRGKTECAGDDWREQAHRLRAFADSFGVEFSQSHLPYYPVAPAAPIEGRPGFFEYFKDMIERAIEISAILGAKWGVVHPFTDTVLAEWSNEANLKMNLDFYRPIVEYAKKFGFGIAIENMQESRPELHRRYCSSAKELVDLIDAFNDPFVGACWDTGHANNMYRDQTKALKMIGKRLKSTHIDDNPTGYDAHTAPFIEGTIDWPAVMRTLKEIGYEGDFTYEIHGMTKWAPDALKDSIAKFTCEIGMYLLSL